MVREGLAKVRRIMFEIFGYLNNLGILEVKEIQKVMTLWITIIFVYLKNTSAEYSQK